jgi:hypothetical protein
MAWRISCGMILRRGIAIGVVLAGGCRGETAPVSEPPPAATRGPSPSAAPQEREPTRAEADGKEPTMTTPEPSPAPDTAPVPLGPPLAAGEVAPAFQRWWATWSSEHLAAHPLRARLDERVKAGGNAKAEACDVLAEHVRGRAPVGSPELLYGDPAALLGRSDRCWWLHHDGMMGAGLGAALASDGRVLAVWVVLEG